MPIAASSSAQPPKTDITHMLNCCRDTEVDTIASIDSTSVTGRPVVWRSVSWICVLSDCGGTCVRTIHEIGVRLTLSALAASGTCACGMNICGCGSLSRPLLLMSATTPTIWRSVSAANSRITPWPISSLSASGSAFGQYCLAMASLMMTTGVEAPVSRSLNVRPRFTGILNTSK